MNTFKEFEHTVADQSLLLTPYKALFWKNEETLVISDVHLGKAGHFRKHGIALPQSSNDENLSRIDHLISVYQPSTILFLGDLFHSEKNAEWYTFKEWRLKYSSIRFLLIMGNHEIYPETDYELMGVECYTEFLKSGILFVHDELERTSETKFSFCISGHVHPAIQMKGKGRQKLRLPCFYIREDALLMPAFGSLTGTYTIKPKEKDLVITMLDNQLIQIQ